MRLILTVLLGLWLTGCGGGSSSSGGSNGSNETPSPTPPDTTIATELSAELQGLPLAVFFETADRALLRRNPEAIIELGLEDSFGLDSSLLTDVSDSYDLVTYQLVDVILQNLQQYDRDLLDSTDRLSYDAYQWTLQDRANERQYLLFSYPISSALWSAEYQTRLFFTDLHPLQDRQDAENFVARLWSIDDKIYQLIDNLQSREDAGMVAPRLALQGAMGPIRDLADHGPESSVYYTAFRDRLALISALDQSDADALLESARQAIADTVIPAYRELGDYIDHLITVAPLDIGVSQFDGGAEYYQHLLQYHTSTDLTAAEIHQLGMAELARIHGDMQVIFSELGYPDSESLTQSFARVAADSGYVSAPNVVPTYQILIAEAEAELAAAFNTVHPTEVIVIGVASGGFYVGGSLDGSRPAAFYASVGGDQPYYQMPSLAYHETVPGHHLQIAIAQRLDLPSFRTAGRFTSYVEGWALYAERLASDLGWYADDPHGNLGRLQWEALRACRLALDTGIHAEGWSFDQAVEFFTANTGFSASFARGQVHRYMVVPGQATAYMIGMLKILELRAEATDQLGNLFDLKVFHDTVLLSGALPMPLLDWSSFQ
jgi:uncharacterized protein (DUF885 family)|tara:strand:- start:22 stop:1833 length:1812 start_codon:yes stop_codon:yes gene_type:complete